MTGPETQMMFQIYMNKQDEQTYVNRDMWDHDKLHDPWEWKLGAKNQSFDMVWVELVTYKCFRRVAGEGLQTKDVMAVHTEEIEGGDPLDRKAVPPR